MNAFLGLLLGAAGVSGLYSSWRKGPWSGGALVALSWALVAASLWAWSRGLGMEFGVSAGLLAFSLLGAVLVLLNFELRQRKAPASRETLAISVDARSWPRHAALFLLVVPVAGVASVLATVLACSLLPWEPANEMALAVLLVPLTWGLAAFWACADPRPLRPALALPLLAVATALCIYL